MLELLQVIQNQSARRLYWSRRKFYGTDRLELSRDGIKLATNGQVGSLQT